MSLMRGPLVSAGDFPFRAELMWGSERRAVWVQQSFVPGAEAEFDKSARIRGDLSLPAVFRLIADHRIFCALVPNAGCFAIETMLTNERGLNLPSPLGADDLLSMDPACSAFAFCGGGAHVALGGASRVAHFCKLDGSVVMLASGMSRKLWRAALTAGLGGGGARQEKNRANR